MNLINNSYINKCIEHNNIIFTRDKNLEMLKYAKNNPADDVHDLCLKKKINYDEIISWLKN
jgi:hypothetical protein